MTKGQLDRRRLPISERRIVSQTTLHNLHQEKVACSLAVCKAQAELCGHEKVMLSVAALLVAGVDAYLLLG